MAQQGFGGSRIILILSDHLTTKLPKYIQILYLSRFAKMKRPVKHTVLFSFKTLRHAVITVGHAPFWL